MHVWKRNLFYTIPTCNTWMFSMCSGLSSALCGTVSRHTHHASLCSKALSVFLPNQEQLSVSWSCICFCLFILSVFFVVLAFWTHRFLSTSHTPRWGTAAVTQPQWRQQVESTGWGGNCKRKVNNSFSLWSVKTAVNMLMQCERDPTTLHLFYILCVTLTICCI